MERKDRENKREQQPASRCYRREETRVWDRLAMCEWNTATTNRGSETMQVVLGGNVESFSFARRLISLVMCNVRDQF